MRPLKHALTTVILMLLASGATAQTAEARARLKALKPADYPAKTIELTVGFAAGGAMDIVARQLAQKFQDYTGENMVVQNRTGAGGLVFNRWLLMQAPTDGYAIGLGNNMIIGDSLLRSENKWSYHDADSLAFISYEPVIWFTSASGRFKNLPLSEIIKAAKKDKADVRVGTVAATLIETLAEQVEQKAGVSFNQIPFNGGKPAIAALMGDHIDISFGFLGEVRGMGDKLRPVAVASHKPVASLSAVPTFNAVFNSDDMNWVIWRYIIAPKGIPAARRTWLIAVFNEMMKDAQLNADLEKNGGIQDASIDTPAKVSAELERLAAAERKFYVQTGLLK
ncbi:MAG: tripartite tricarboxylate transporter substrate binding protein [Limnohabitans sp.]|nr:tripartite tricarboxylate transporter substrate binding protein [Limnohabitans sp.]